MVELCLIWHNRNGSYKPTLDGAPTARQVEALSENIVWVCTDGGAIWTPISNPPSPISGGAGIINAFQFYDEMNGWFGTTAHGLLIEG